MDSDCKGDVQDNHSAVTADDSKDIESVPDVETQNRLKEIHTWWEIPAIAHFCSLFKAVFGFCDFDIEDLEDALLNSPAQGGSTLVVDIICQLLNGCYARDDIKYYNYDLFLKDIFKQRWQVELGHTSPMTDTTFLELSIRRRVEVLHALCDFRLDADDVAEMLKGLSGDSLRVEPLGVDGKGAKYWYFYGTRLYKETPELEPEEEKPKGRRGRRKPFVEELDAKEFLDKEDDGEKGSEDVEQVKRNPVLSAKPRLVEKMPGDEEEEEDLGGYMKEEEINDKIVDTPEEEEDDVQKELAEAVYESENGEVDDDDGDDVDFEEELKKKKSSKTKKKSATKKAAAKQNAKENVEEIQETKFIESVCKPKRKRAYYRGGKSRSRSRSQGKGTKSKSQPEASEAETTREQSESKASATQKQTPESKPEPVRRSRRRMKEDAEPEIVFDPNMPQSELKRLTVDGFHNQLKTSFSRSSSRKRRGGKDVDSVPEKQQIVSSTCRKSIEDTALSLSAEIKKRAHKKIGETVNNVPSDVVVEDQQGLESQVLENKAEDEQILEAQPPVQSSDSNKEINSDSTTCQSDEAVPIPAQKRGSSRRKSTPQRRQNKSHVIFNDTVKSEILQHDIKYEVNPDELSLQSVPKDQHHQDLQIPSDKSVLSAATHQNSHDVCSQEMAELEEESGKKKSDEASREGGGNESSLACLTSTGSTKEKGEEDERIIDLEHSGVKEADKEIAVNLTEGEWRVPPGLSDIVSNDEIDTAMVVSDMSDNLKKPSDDKSTKQQTSDFASEVVKDNNCVIQAHTGCILVNTTTKIVSASMDTAATSVNSCDTDAGSALKSDPSVNTDAFKHSNLSMNSPDELHKAHLMTWFKPCIKAETVGTTDSSEDSVRSSNQQGSLHASLTKTETGLSTDSDQLSVMYVDKDIKEEERAEEEIAENMEVDVVGDEVDGVVGGAEEENSDKRVDEDVTHCMERGSSSQTLGGGGCTDGAVNSQGPLYQESVVENMEIQEETAMEVEAGKCVENELVGAEKVPSVLNKISLQSTGEGSLSCTARIRSLVVGESSGGDRVEVCSSEQSSGGDKVDVCSSEQSIDGAVIEDCHSKRSDDGDVAKVCDNNQSKARIDQGMCCSKKSDHKRVVKVCDDAQSDKCAVAKECSNDDNTVSSAQADMCAVAKECSNDDNTVSSAQADMNSHRSVQGLEDVQSCTTTVEAKTSLATSTDSSSLPASSDQNALPIPVVKSDHSSLESISSTVDHTIPMTSTVDNSQPSTEIQPHSTDLSSSGCKSLVLKRPRGGDESVADLPTKVHSVCNNFTSALKTKHPKALASSTHDQRALMTRQSASDAKLQEKSVSVSNSSTTLSSKTTSDVEEKEFGHVGRKEQLVESGVDEVVVDSPKEDRMCHGELKTPEATNVADTGNVGGVLQDGVTAAEDGGLVLEGNCEPPLCNVIMVAGTVGGEVYVETSSGEAAVETSSGDEAMVEASSTEAAVETSSGVAAVETSSGDEAMVEASSTEAAVKTSSAEAAVETSSGEAAVEAAVEASSGEATVEASSVETTADTNSVETPANTSSVETPAEASSVETPADKSRVETPTDKISVETPADKSSVETPADKSRVETPADTISVETSSVETPAETSSVETPAETSSVETPAETSNVETPAETSSVETSSVETPAETSSVETPAETSNVETPAETSSVETPAETSNVETPAETSSVEASSVETPAEPSSVDNNSEASSETLLSDSTTNTSPDLNSIMAQSETSRVDVDHTSSQLSASETGNTRINFHKAEFRPDPTNDLAETSGSSQSNMNKEDINVCVGKSDTLGGKNTEEQFTEDVEMMEDGGACVMEDEKMDIDEEAGPPDLDSLPNVDASVATHERSSSCSAANEVLVEESTLKGDVEVETADGALEKAGSALEKADLATMKDEADLEKADSTAEKDEADVKKADSAVEKDEAFVVEKDDTIMEGDETVAEKADNDVERVNTVVEKADSAAEKDEAIVEKDYTILGRDETVVEKADSTAEKDESVVEKADSAAEKDDNDVEKEKDDTVVDRDETIAEKTDFFVENGCNAVKKADSYVEKAACALDNTAAVKAEVWLEKADSGIDINFIDVGKDVDDALLQTTNTCFVKSDGSAENVDSGAEMNDSADKKEDSSAMTALDLSTVTGDSADKKEDSSAVTVLDLSTATGDSADEKEDSSAMTALDLSTVTGDSADKKEDSSAVTVLDLSTTTGDSADEKEDSSAMTALDLSTATGDSADKKEDSSAMTALELSKVAGDSADEKEDSSAMTARDLSTVTGDSADKKEDSSAMTALELSKVAGDSADEKEDSSAMTARDLSTVTGDSADKKEDSSAMTALDLSKVAGDELVIAAANSSSADKSVLLDKEQCGLMGGHKNAIEMASAASDSVINASSATGQLLHKSDSSRSADITVEDSRDNVQVEETAEELAQSNIHHDQREINKSDTQEFGSKEKGDVIETSDIHAFAKEARCSVQGDELELLGSDPQMTKVPVPHTCSDTVITTQSQSSALILNVSEMGIDLDVSENGDTADLAVQVQQNVVGQEILDISEMNMNTNVLTAQCTLKVVAGVQETDCAIEKDETNIVKVAFNQTVQKNVVDTGAVEQVMMDMPEADKDTGASENEFTLDQAVRVQQNVVNTDGVGQEILDVPEANKDGQEILDVPETNKDGQEILDVPEANKDGQEILDVPETNKDGQEILDVPEASKDGQEILDVPETNKDGQEILDVPEASKDGQEILDVPETSKDGQETLDVPETSKDAEVSENKVASDQDVHVQQNVVSTDTLEQDITLNDGPQPAPVINGLVPDLGSCSNVLTGDDANEDKMLGADEGIKNNAIDVATKPDISEVKEEIKNEVKPETSFDLGKLLGSFTTKDDDFTKKVALYCDERPLQGGLSHWQLVCDTVEDWDQLTLEFKDTKLYKEKLLYRIIKNDFLPEIPAIMADKLQAREKRAREMMPRRSSYRLELKKMEEEEKERLTREAEEEEERHKAVVDEERRHQMKVEEEKRQREEREKAREERANRARLREERARLIAEGKEIPPELMNGLKQDEFDQDDVDEEMQFNMERILLNVKRNEYSWPFLEAVEEVNTPDFFDTIKEPMDLMQIDRKLAERAYKTKEQFERDMNLVFDNCIGYHGKDSDFGYMAENLKGVFERSMRRTFRVYLEPALHRGRRRETWGDSTYDCDYALAGSRSHLGQRSTRRKGSYKENSDSDSELEPYMTGRVIYPSGRKWGSEEEQVNVEDKNKIRQEGGAAEEEKTADDENESQLKPRATWSYRRELLGQDAADFESYIPKSSGSQKLEEHEPPKAVHQHIDVSKFAGAKFRYSLPINDTSRKLPQMIINQYVKKEKLQQAADQTATPIAAPVRPPVRVVKISREEYEKLLADKKITIVSADNPAGQIIKLHAGLQFKETVKPLVPSTTSPTPSAPAESKVGQASTAGSDEPIKSSDVSSHVPKLLESSSLKPRSMRDEGGGKRIVDIKARLREVNEKMANKLKVPGTKEEAVYENSKIVKGQVIFNVAPNKMDSSTLYGESYSTQKRKMYHKPSKYLDPCAIPLVEKIRQSENEVEKPRATPVKRVRFSDEFKVLERDVENQRDDHSSVHKADIGCGPVSHPDRQKADDRLQSHGQVSSLSVAASNAAHSSSPQSSTFSSSLPSPSKSTAIRSSIYEKWKKRVNKTNTPYVTKTSHDDDELKLTKSTPNSLDNVEQDVLEHKEDSIGDQQFLSRQKTTKNRSKKRSTTSTENESLSKRQKVIVDELDDTVTAQLTVPSTEIEPPSQEPGSSDEALALQGTDYSVNTSHAEMEEHLIQQPDESSSDLQNSLHEKQSSLKRQINSSMDEDEQSNKKMKVSEEELSKVLQKLKQVSPLKQPLVSNIDSSIDNLSDSSKPVQPEVEAFQKLSSSHSEGLNSHADDILPKENGKCRKMAAQRTDGITDRDSFCRALELQHKDTALTASGLDLPMTSGSTQLEVKPLSSSAATSSLLLQHSSPSTSSSSSSSRSLRLPDLSSQLAQAIAQKKKWASEEKHFENYDSPRTLSPPLLEPMQPVGDSDNSREFVATSPDDDDDEMPVLVPDHLPLSLVEPGTDNIFQRMMSPEKSKI